MEREELKPCPFCGGKAKLEDCGDYRYFVRCEKCSINQDHLYHAKKDAAKAWNRRVEMQDVLDNLDAYEAYEKEQEKELASRPKCAWCGEPIQEECAYRIDRELVCEHCIEDVREYID